VRGNLGKKSFGGSVARGREFNLRKSLVTTIFAEIDFWN
jgi:hypothetical protein